MKRKKFFVTGIAGYVGEALARELDRTSYCTRFWGMDIKRPLSKFKVGEFREMDINSPALVDWIKEVRPDVVVHLAFVVDPLHDRNLMHRINVDGTKNVLKAVKEAGVPQLVITSSATAYGAWPDNPVPLKEDDPIRQHPHFQYAKDKAEVEFVLADFVKENPDITVSWVRPCVIYGPNVNNYISGLFTMPLAISPVGHDPIYQFVHEDDVVAALMALVKKEVRGPYNLAPPDIMSVREINRLTGKPAVPSPNFMLKAAFAAAWKLHLPLLRVPASFLDYVRYPWVVDSTRLCQDTGFDFMYSTRETIEIMLRAKGAL